MWKKTTGAFFHFKHGGVGLANVKQRLDLIYQDRYMLDIKDEPELYTVTLNIPL